MSDVAQSTPSWLGSASSIASMNWLSPEIVVDITLCALAAEVMILGVLPLLVRKGFPSPWRGHDAQSKEAAALELRVSLMPTLLSGLGLVVALRVVLQQGPWWAVLSGMSFSLAWHVADLIARLRSGASFKAPVPRSSQANQRHEWTR